MIKNGINTNTGETYQEYVEKFKERHTTDDTFTPDYIYEIIEDYVAKEYGIDKSNFIRPFWPGEDYTQYEYGADEVVVDNPPFSILSQIIRFYMSKGIKFFLFCPGLTSFSSSSSSCSVICCVATIEYDNEAIISTSFVTNLEPHDLRARTSPELYKKITDAVKLHRSYKSVKGNEIPKYRYPDVVVTAAMMNKICKGGVQFKFTRSGSYRVSKLDHQAEQRKGIFGSGYLITEKAAAEKAAAEKAAEQEVIEWQLSDREQAIIKKLKNA